MYYLPILAFFSSIPILTLFLLFVLPAFPALVAHLVFLVLLIFLVLLALLSFLLLLVLLEFLVLPDLLVSVSYTHLDVYKRQVILHINIFNSLTLFDRFCYIWDSINWETKGSAVSYTHLDVYKRQIQVMYF